jgi:AmiR/NasT family two-component response regulator
MSARRPDEIRSEAQSRASPEERPGAFAALGVSAHPNDLHRLREILTGMRSKLHEARSCHEASTLLCSFRMPIIVCDRLLPDGNWKDILSLTAPLLESPHVIVMSEAVEPSWASEVREMGGYGVLAKPLDETEVIRILVVALRSWQNAWAGSVIAVNAA